MIIEKAYAKINLALEVMEKIDGYHKVNNVMIPISLFDEIVLSISNKTHIKDDNIEDNICLKAAQLFLNEFNIDECVEIVINKKIPKAAGLAGGSSDAASVLKGLNKLFNINASNEVLKKLAAKLGSDVAFFIENKPALCTNRGEIITPLECNLDDYYVLLINPKVELSTAYVYANYTYNYANKENMLNSVIDALKYNDIDMLKNNIFNDLEDVALKLSSELNDIYTKLIKEGFNPRVSGSGPTIYLINPTDYEIEWVKKNLFDITNIFLTKIKY